MKTPETRKTVIANIKALMDAAGESQHSLVKRIGWRQSTLGNLLSGNHNIAIERAEVIAQAYGLEGWHLLLKDLPQDLQRSKTIAKLFAAYMASSEEGRAHIDMVAEREASYGNK
jgi:transcriptional regulator with XRE-family HTH domain